MNDIKFVVAKVTNKYITSGLIYKVELYDHALASILILNTNPMEPCSLIEFPLELFDVYEPLLIHVDFVNKKRAA